MTEREYELLVKPYNSLTMQERAEALQLARQFGEQASTPSYRLEIVMTAEVLGIKDIDPVLDTRDPRVRFFKRGFKAAQQREEE